MRASKGKYPTYGFRNQVGTVVQWNWSHVPLWVISGHAGLHEEASALPLKADILQGAEIVSFVPLANIDCPDLLVGKLMNLKGSQ